MADGFQGTGPVLVRRADIVVRGLGYGFVSGLATGVLVAVAVSSYSFVVFPDGGQAVLGIPLYAMLGGAAGAIVGSVVGLFGGVMFALAAPYLTRHRALAVAAGLTVPAEFLAVVYAGLALSHLADGTPIFTDATGPAHLTRLTLVMWAVTAPAGGLVAHRVLYGRQVSPTNMAE